MSSVLQEQIALAQEKAAQNNQAVKAVQEPEVVAQTQPTSIAPANQNNAVAAQPVNSALSIEDALNSSMVVDSWLKVESGTVTVEDETYLQIPVKLLCGEIRNGGSIAPFIGLNYGEDTDTKYTKTYSNGSGVVDEGENQGTPWAEHVENVKNIYGSAKTFIGYQLVMEVAEDTKAAKGDAILKKGTILGYSTSKTSAKEVAKLLKTLQRQGKWGDADTAVLVDVSGTGKQANINGKNVKWAVITLEFKGDYVDEDDL